MSQSPEMQQIEVPFETDDPEVIAAAKYLLMKEKKWNTQQIAEAFGYAHRNSVYSMQKAWLESGALDKAQELLLQPRADAIRAAYSKVLENWGSVVDRVLRIAVHSRSDRNALEAAAWLKAEVVDPTLATARESGSAEAAYARGNTDLNPTEIVVSKDILERLQKKN